MKFFRFALTLIAATSIAAGTARAGTIIATPAGLNPGDHFRIVFVTAGTINPTSTNITTYDNFVTSQADSATYNGATITWQAIGSTSSVNAIDHIGVTGDAVYLVDGTEVASTDSTSGLWSGALLHAINELITGSTSGGSTYTGTTASGVASTYYLGASAVEIGSTTSQNSSWVALSRDTRPTVDARLVFGISQELTAAQTTSSVPEPSTAMLAGLGGLVALAYSFKRKRGGGQSSSPSV